MLRRLVVHGENSDCIAAQKKYYKIIKNERPRKVLSIHDFIPGESESNSNAEVLIELHVQEGLLSKRQHIYRVYQDKSAIFYYDYADPK